MRTRLSCCFGLVLVAAACSRDGARPVAPEAAQAPPGPEPVEPAGDDAATATAILEPRSGSTVQGLAAFSQRPGGVEATITVTGAEPGPHGIHVHERGDCSAPDASSAGDHFAPEGNPHGAPGEDSHAGDMGNILVDETGKGVTTVFLPDVTIERGAPNSVVGKAVIVHARPDDLTTQPSGDSGARVACGVLDTVTE